METTKRQIKRALDNNEFILHYQPKINFLTGRICGAEALVRWESAERGLIPPDAFIPLAERAGIITEITAQIIPMAVQALKTLESNGFSGKIAVNISPHDFKTGRIVSLLQETIEKNSIKPENIQIELTETAQAGENDNIATRLHELADAGMELIMDDFGTGYSSLDLLSRLPFSTIKIDRGFVRRMAESTKNLNIVNMIINMARTLRVNTVAEGIENHNTYRFLAYAGCMEAQGYWTGRPMPLEAFASVLQDKGTQWPSSHLGMIYHARMNNAYFHKSIIDSVLYAICGVREEMSSVTRPDIQFNPEETRLGQWYYGAGQALAESAHFKAIEKPHRTMHEIGELLFKDSYAGNSEKIGKFILKFNQAFEDVNRQLHLLESELIAVEPCQKWHMSQDTEAKAKTG